MNVLFETTYSVLEDFSHAFPLNYNSVEQACVFQPFLMSQIISATFHQKFKNKHISE